MKIVAMLAVGLCAVTSFAQKKPKDPEIRCAVQGSKTSIKQAMKDKMFTDYKGRRYFFCCSGCPEEFKAHPEKYAKKADSIPTPKPAPKKKK